MKIGIYGGTFDPPHNGHVYACQSFYDAFDMDKLYIIPTAIPPHKLRASDVSADLRFEMAKLAFSGIGDKVEFSDIEIKRAGKSYTKDTIRHFVDRGVGEILLLCGTDMFVTFDEWVDFQYIFNNATIVCIRRENDEKYTELIKNKSAEYVEKYNAKLEYIDVPAVEISSTDIRNDIRGDSAKALIPKPVYDFILERGLYI